MSHLAKTIKQFWNSTCVRDHQHVYRVKHYSAGHLKKKGKHDEQPQDGDTIWRTSDLRYRESLG